MDSITVALAILVSILVLLMWVEFRNNKNEYLTLEPSVDMVDFRHSDPKYSKYSRRLTDTMGMDASDYYYENDILHRQNIIDFQELYGDSAFEAIEGSHGMPGQRGGGPTAERFKAIDGGFIDLGSVGSAEPAIGGLSDLEQYQKTWAMDGNPVLPDL